MTIIRRYFLLIFFFTIACSVNAESGKRACFFPQNPSYPGNVFEPIAWPVSDLDSFASGRIGIVRPTYDHFYLFITYRLLAGLPVTTSDIEHLRHSDPCWHTAANDSFFYDPTQEEAFQMAQFQWETERIKAYEVFQLKENNRQHISSSFNYPDYSDYLNCHADAFRNAAVTLRNRLSLYGSDPNLLDWVRAQDIVFSNCVKSSGQPTDVQQSSPRWLKLDRDYQQAAALFYAGRYELAIQKFDAIATTADSPWHEIAPYLAARAVIRWGTTERGREPSQQLAKLTEAESRLTKILGQPLEANLRTDVERLLQFVQLRTQPNIVLNRLDSIFTAGQLPDSIGQDVTDFWFAYAAGSGRDSQLPFSQWLTALRDKGDSATSAIDQWREAHQLPWLVAAIQQTTPTSDYLEEILADAKKVHLSSPGYVTIRYHLARLTPDNTAAIRIVEETLKSMRSSMSVQDINAFKHIGLERSTTIKEFAHFAPRETAMQMRGILPNIDHDSVRTFNQGLPLDTLVRIVAMKDVPEELRQELTIVVWTRAFVLNRWDVIKKFAPQIRSLVPDSASLVDDMLRESDQNTRQAIGAMLLARYPGMVGNVRDNIVYTDQFNEFSYPNMHRWFAQEGSRENWWCGFPNDAYWIKKGYTEHKDEPQ
ncbi:MAG: hypothetical protein ACXU8A_13500, partial [Burkholderiaceae bacterium]